MADQTTTRSWVRDVALLLVAALVGAGIFFIATRDSEGGPAVDVDVPTAGASDVDRPTVAAGAGDDVVPVAPEDAVDPETAVTSFLAAEVDRDFEASYALLDDVTRSRVGTLQGWTNAHANFPRIIGFEVVGADGDTVTADLALDSKLDPVIGLVPATATAEWVTDETAEGHRVVFDESVLTPVYPDAAPARDAALAWARGVQAGEDVDDLQAVNRLAGRAGLRQLLTDADGELEAGEPFVLPPDGGDANLLNRFGAGVVEWGRGVPITGAADVTVVLAPVGDDWLVVGLVNP